MKNFKTYILITLVLHLLGCDFKDINVDPNNITGEKLSLNQRLPSLEYYLANTLASSVPRSVNNTMGQVIYIQGNTGLNTYLYSVSDPSKTTLWNDLYARIMFNADQIIKESDKTNAFGYRGIAKVAYAVALANATSIFGDVPYNQIFNTGTYPNPAFDKQEDIYNGIQKMLDEAITDLSNGTGSNIKPSTDDFIFKGDLNKWIKTAYALKARYYLHVVKQQEGAYDLCLTALSTSLVDNSDNALFKFQAGNPDQTHPLYNERVGTQNTQLDGKFTDLMNMKKDPRLPFFSTVKSSITTGKRSLYGPLYSSKDSYVPIITYEECLFMKAEIAMYKSGKNAAETDFKAAIRASLERVCTVQNWTADSAAAGVPILSPTSSLLGLYITNQGNIDSLSSNDLVWKRIFEQKFIALFLQGEVWNDYRRATKYVSGVDGLPTITPRAGTAIPRRYNYPFNETNYNTSTPTDPGIFGRVWWDK